MFFSITDLSEALYDKSIDTDSPQFYTEEQIAEWAKDEADMFIRESELTFLATQAFGMEDTSYDTLCGCILFLRHGLPAHLIWMVHNNNVFGLYARYFREYLKQQLVKASIDNLLP